MRLAEARRIAEDLAAVVAPHCYEVCIAGSIRREKLDVKDLELVVIPRWAEEAGTDLFGTPEPVNTLHRWALAQKEVRWIKPGVPDVIDWTPKADGKYWRGILANGLKLDLFLATQANWGAILLIRTGSADFSQAVVTQAKRIGKNCVDGHFTLNGERVETPTEQAVFDLLSLEYVRPPLRIGPESLRRA